MQLRNKLFIAFFLLSSAFLVSCANDNSTSDTQIKAESNIVILYTNDEHGWMEGSDNHGGFSSLMYLWKNIEGYKPNSNYLILSGGDNWTGPAISSATKGEAMTDVMNAIKYDASTVGNHEYDFGLEVIAERMKQADYPYLSANIRLKSNGATPDYVNKYIIKEVDGVKVGIIGLTTIDLHSLVMSKYVEDIDCMPYKDALEEVVPEIKKAGAELLICIGHVSSDDFSEYAEKARELGITLVTGGHNHVEYSNVDTDFAIVEAASYLNKYARIDINFDNINKSVKSIKVDVKENDKTGSDAIIDSIVNKWKESTEELFSEIIGYVTEPIDKSSEAMSNMICDSWIYRFPESDISFMNSGGIRQDLPAGEISIATVMGILPFENTIYEIELTGDQIKQSINDVGPLLGGMSTISGYKLSDGTALQDDSVYTLLLTDYMYLKESSYSHFMEYDPTPNLTAINWREPLIEWIKSKETNEANPLDQYLDNEARR